MWMTCSHELESIFEIKRFTPTKTTMTRVELLNDCRLDAQKYRFKSPDDQIERIAELLADKAELLVLLDESKGRERALETQIAGLKARLVSRRAETN